ncbi:MAG: glycosyltransferase [bacterium]|nr:glycosyltransferase [bacterium]
MKLLIITQKVDDLDPILGFFTRWIQEFGRSCDSLTVIGQSIGQHALPTNIDVCSLGKQKADSRLSQILTFWRLIIAKRGQYDRVLVHMTPIWVVLGAPVWLLLHKRVYLWYESRGARWPLRYALLVTQKVFSASVQGMPIATDKSVITGHGIDTEEFTMGVKKRIPHSLITIGRITKAKKMDVLIKAVSGLPPLYSLKIVGHPITSEDQTYLQSLQEIMDERMSIVSLTHHEVSQVLQSTEIFVHASTTPLDKAVLEAMASGCIVISSCDAVTPLLLPSCQATEKTFAARIVEVGALPQTVQEEIRSKQRKIVEQNHSLKTLIAKLVKEMCF